MLHFIYWRNHRLCCSWRLWWHRPYFIVKFPLSLCILFVHCSLLCQVSIYLIYFSPLKFFWVLASSLDIVIKLFLIFGESEPQCSYKVCSFKKKKTCIMKINTSLQKVLVKVIVKNFINKERCGSRKTKECKRRNHKIKLVEEINSLILKL